MQQIINRNNIWLRIAQAALVSFTFLFSFQIRTLIYSEPLFLNGNFNPYTSFFLYFNDLIIIIGLIAFGIECIKNKKTLANIAQPKIIIILLTGILFALSHSILISEKPLLSYLSIFRFLTFYIYIFLATQKIITPKILTTIFISSIVTQSMIAIFQYTFQESIGLSLLGESTIKPNLPGVAKIALTNSNIIRSYGTLPHPNILGGTLFVGIILSINRFKKLPWFYTLIILIQTAAMIMTFSRSAWLGLIIAAFVWYSLQENKIRISLKLIALTLSLSLFIIITFNIEEVFFNHIVNPNSPAFTERTIFFDISKNMFLDQPLGVGIGEFTSQMQNYSIQKLAPWSFQPVHNVFLLIANELGIIGFIIFLFTVAFVSFEIFINTKKTPQKQQKLISIIAGFITIMMFDHYFFTSYAGQFLLAFLIILTINTLEQKPQSS